MADSDKALRVRRHPLWGHASAPQFSAWVLECAVCDDSMEFATWADAQAAAVHHAERHKRETCRACGQAPWIRYSEWP